MVNSSHHLQTKGNNMTTETKSKTDWSLIPVHIINFKNLTLPSDITAIFKKLGIDYYLYQFSFLGIVLKYGMSADNSGDWGERVCRQAGHGPFWGEDFQFRSSSGAEFRIILEEFKRKYGIDVLKDGLVLRVWDVTNYPFDSMDPWMEVNTMERQLIEDYVNVMGEKPVGNIDQEVDYRKRARIRKEDFNSLFDYTDTPPTVKRIRKKK
jgi:hypothetical protein